MSSSSSPGSGLHRRPVNPSASAGGGPLRPDVDPPPKPPRFLQLLSIALIVLLACLQLLPATHFRGPSRPGGGSTWIPFHPDPTSTEEVGDGRIHVVSWMDCLDLRALAVLANSTLSNSRLAENVYFHFFVPEGEDEKLSYYKLKVLFPRLNLDIIGQKGVKEKLQTALPEWELLWPSLHELLPFIIPSITPSFSRFIYVSSDLIIKGHIEELFGVDLGPYAIATAEDCTKQLGDYVKIDIVNAIQRTAAKTWVSSEPYDTHACIPDFSVVLVDIKNVDKVLVEAIPWWNKVLGLKDERKEVNPAIALALYNRYLKLPSDWKLDATVPPRVDNESNVLHYDGPIRICSEVSKQRLGSDIGNMWRQYLPPKSDAILDH